MAQDQLLEHEYDGIQEYDNPCPGWWHAIFWLTVLFSAVYFLFFHVGGNGWTLAEAWNTAKSDDMRERFKGIGELRNDVPTLLKYKADDDWMVYARSVFLTNCQSCHGPDGGGYIGPNLTDDYYKNVNKITDIAEVIKSGAGGGAMPSWRTKLQQNDVVLLASYVASLRGKNLPGKAKLPEDKLIEPWPTAVGDQPKGRGEDKGPPLPPGEGRGEGKSPPLPPGEGRGEGRREVSSGYQKKHALSPCPSPGGRGESDALTPCPGGRGEHQTVTPIASLGERGESDALTPCPSPGGRGEPQSLTPGDSADARGGSFAPPQPDARVLSTLMGDGSRRWLHPRPAAGAYLRARRVLAYILIAIFTLLPYLKLHGKPAVLLDLRQREFTVFGFTFLSTDTLLLALVLITLILGICLVTALAGRVWCGWMCPQTVYMEFVFRPIERLFDGPPGAQHRPGRKRTALRSMAKYALYLLISVYLAHTFLAYFVGVEELAQWVRSSPLDHPAPFAVMVLVTGLMMFDFACFREQACIVACPYGRFQSVMLDRDSLIVSYDPRRGEPRRKLAQRRAGQAGGDCIDCGLCTDTCPTGIDIRDGLQLECIACTQCIDACNGVMTRIGKPKGLVRLSSQAAIQGEAKRVLRPRVVIYPALMLVLATAIAIVFWNKKSADVTVLQGVGLPYTEIAPGEIANQVRVVIENRSGRDAVYKIEMGSGVQAHFARDPGPIVLKIEEPVKPPVAIERSSAVHPRDREATKKPSKIPVATVALVIVAPIDAFRHGVYDIRLRVSDDKTFQQEVACRLLGPVRRPTAASGTSK